MPPPKWFSITGRLRSMSARWPRRNRDGKYQTMGGGSAQARLSLSLYLRSSRSCISGMKAFCSHWPGWLQWISSAVGHAFRV